MNSALFSTGLHFNGRYGVAKLYGREMRLTQRPLIAGLPRYDKVDYVPETGRRAIREPGADWRDLGPAEIRAVDAFLRQVLAP